MGLSWSDIGGVIGKAAPIVGGLLGGPAGAAVGALVAHELGSDPTPDAVSAAVAADPAAMEKIQELQINAKVQLQQLSVQAEQNRLVASAAQYAAETADRDSARKMAMSKPEDWWIRPLVVVLLILGAIAIIVFMFIPGTRDVLHDANATGMLGLVFGYWFSELKTALAFYFGATKSGTDNAQAITNFAVSPGTVTSETK